MVHGYPDYSLGKSPEAFKLGELEVKYILDNPGVNAGATATNTLDLSSTGKKWRPVKVYLSEETVNRPLEFEFTSGGFGIPVIFFTGSFTGEFPGLESTLNPTITYELTNNHSSEKAWCTVIIVLIEVVPD